MSQIQKSLRNLQHAKTTAAGPVTSQPVILPIIHPGQPLAIEAGFNIYRWRDDYFINDRDTTVIDRSTLSMNRAFTDHFRQSDTLFLLDELNPAAAAAFAYFRNIIYIPAPAEFARLGRFIAGLTFHRIKVMLQVLLPGTSLLGDDLVGHNRAAWESAAGKNRKLQPLLGKIDGQLKQMTHNILLPDPAAPEPGRAGRQAMLDGMERLNAIRQIRGGYACYFDDSRAVFNNLKDLAGEIGDTRYLLANNYFNPVVI